MLIIDDLIMILDICPEFILSDFDLLCDFQTQYLLPTQHIYDEIYFLGQIEYMIYDEHIYLEIYISHDD